MRWKNGRKCAALMLAITQLFTGCGAREDKEGKTVVSMLQYKPEAADYFVTLQEEFNRTHDDIYLKIDSPNDAMTILKTRLIREDYPDILGIGGDINYSYFVDSEILEDVSDYEGLKKIKSAYTDMLEELEFVPTEGTFGVPYVANAAGVLYNKDMFEEHGWEIPKTWDEFMVLCSTIQNAGIQPLVFGFKDTWTCLAPWNALAVDLAPADVCQKVNRGDTNFETEYKETAEKIKELISYGTKDTFAYGYNDACTAFATGKAAMYTIGSYAVPQIESVNPDINLDSFVMPGSDEQDHNVLNSGIDLQFCVTKESQHKEAAYQVLDFLLEHDHVQAYLNNQNAVPCMDEDFELAPMLAGMSEYIKEGNMSDFHDHYYPSEMAVDAQIQTFLLDGDVDSFLKKFDIDWIRYNRDVIQKMETYMKQEEGK